MKTSLPNQPQQKKQPFKIKGRMIPYEEFKTRLKSLCLSLGFKKLKISTPLTSMAICAAFTGVPDISAAESMENIREKDRVIILSSKVPYNPRWGSPNWLPSPLVQSKNSSKQEPATANFIDPYLKQYDFGQKHIFLSRAENGQHLITLPKIFLETDARPTKIQLKINLKKFAQADSAGDFKPLSTFGPYSSYGLAREFVQDLDAANFNWKPGQGTAIGKHLTPELFFFTDEGAEADEQYSATIRPDINRIVSHKTPHLEAAKRHLEGEFSRALTALSSSHRQRNLLLIAGLDIDMSACTKGDKHYFVPWKAYLAQDLDSKGDDNPLEQDALFVKLMGQNRQSLT